MLEFESVLNYYLTNDIPLVLFDDFYDLNLRQRGFMLNRVYDYTSREDMIGEIVNQEEAIGVSESYLLMKHDIKEEPHVSHEEHVALFKEKEELAKKIQLIEEQVTLDELPSIKQINQELAKLNQNDLNLALRIHDKMGDKIDFDEELNETSKVIDEEEIRDYLKQEFKIDDNRLNYLLKLYAKYASLLTSKKEVIREIASKNIEDYQNLQDRYREILDTLAVKNVKLANWVVRKYFKYIPAEMEEMQAYALEGLANAINDYNYKLGYRFSTFATLVIKHRIQRYFKVLTGITWDNYLLVVKYNEAVNTYKSYMGEDTEVSIEDLYNSNLFGLSISELTKGEFYSRFLVLPFSHVLPTDPLDLRSDENAMLTSMEDYREEDNYLDNVGDKLGLVANVFDDDLDEAELKNLKENIHEVLGTLTEREENVLRLRFGIDDGKVRTLEEVGRLLSVTRERVRQIEAKALRKLRHAPRSKKIDIYQRNIKHYFDDDTSSWVDELKEESEAKVLSLMLMDYINDPEILGKSNARTIVHRYDIPHDLYEDNYYALCKDYVEKFERIIAMLTSYESYTNVYDVKKAVEEEVKVNLPVDFYLCYFHEVAKITAKRL